MGAFDDEELGRVLNDGTSDANFADKFVGDEAARRISGALSNNCSKTRVLLDRNCVGADGATAVGDMLKVCWSSKYDARFYVQRRRVAILTVFHRVPVVSSKYWFRIFLRCCSTKKYTVPVYRDIYAFCMQPIRIRSRSSCPRTAAHSSSI